VQKRRRTGFLIRAFSLLDAWQARIGPCVRRRHEWEPQTYKSSVPHGPDWFAKATPTLSRESGDEFRDG